MDRKGLKKIPIEKAEQMFKEVGERYGYTDVIVKYAKYKGMKIHWKKSYVWASFSIAHNVAYAPEWFLSELAERLFGQFYGKYVPMSVEAQKWVEDNKYRWEKAEE